MSAEVINFATRGNVVGDGVAITPDDVLTGAVGLNFREVVVLGVDADGDLYLAGSNNNAEAMLLMQLGTHWLCSAMLSED